MKKPLIALALLSAATLGGNAFADDYGCRVMVCLTDPSGPMTQTDCKPAIQKFIEGQNKPKPDPFPSCPEGKPGTMQPALRPYDVCPNETSALGVNIKAIQLSPTMYAQLNSSNALSNIFWTSPTQLSVREIPEGLTVQTGIGEGELGGDPQLSKVCVGKQLGTLTLGFNGPEGVVPTSIAVFEQLVFIRPAGSPRVVDVYIGEQLYCSVRY